MWHETRFAHNWAQIVNFLEDKKKQNDYFKLATASGWSHIDSYWLVEHNYYLMCAI
jgi:hypothetical protein